MNDGDHAKEWKTELVCLEQNCLCQNWDGCFNLNQSPRSGETFLKHMVLPENKRHLLKTRKLLNVIHVPDLQYVYANKQKEALKTLTVLAENRKKRSWSWLLGMIFWKTHQKHEPQNKQTHGTTLN